MERCIRINAENGQKVGFKITKTVVTDVNPGGLADNAGLKVGDRLVKVDGYSCRDMKPENIINFIKVSGANVPGRVRRTNVSELLSLSPELLFFVYKTSI